MGAVQLDEDGLSVLPISCKMAVSTFLVALPGYRRGIGGPRGRSGLCLSCRSTQQGSELARRGGAATGT